MPAEDRLRTLLARAADTVDVGPPLAHPAPRRHRWPTALTIVAALVLVAGVGAVIAGQHHEDPVAVDTQTGRHGHDRVPAVVGRPIEEAIRTLSAAGYRTRVDRVASCALPDRVTSVTPQPGSALPSGDTVTVQYDAMPPNVDCDTDPALTVWSLLDWARGVGEQPQVAATVKVLGHDDRTISRSDPASAWTGLREIAEAATRLTPRGTVDRQPRLTATRSTCAALATCISAVTVKVELQLGDETLAAFNLYLDRRLQISDYALLTAPPSETSGATPSAAAGSVMATVPAVLGLQIDDAKRALIESEFHVATHERATCGDLADRVTDTDPAPGTPLTSGAAVTISYDTTPSAASCFYTPSERVWRFLDWARGGRARPAFAAGGIDIIEGKGSHHLADPGSRSAWPEATAISRAVVSLLHNGDGFTQPHLTVTQPDCSAESATDCPEPTRLVAELSLGDESYASFQLLLSGGRITGYGLVTAPPTAGATTPPASP